MSTATPRRARAVADVVALLHDVDRFRRRVDVGKDALARADELDRARREAADAEADTAADAALTVELERLADAIDAVSTPARRAGVLAFDDPAWSGAAPVPGRAPGLLRVGTLDTEGGARPAAAVVPATRNVVLRAGEDARPVALELVRVLVLRALTDLDAGLLRVLVVDLETAGRPLNVFGTLRDTTPPLVTFAVEPDDALERVRALHARVHELIVGPLRAGGTLAEHDLAAGADRREHHTLVVLPHGLRGLGEPLAEQVRRLARNGPVAGVTVLTVAGNDADVAAVAEPVVLELGADGALALRDGDHVVGRGRADRVTGQHVYDGLLNGVRHDASFGHERPALDEEPAPVRLPEETWPAYLHLVRSVGEALDGHRRAAARRRTLAEQATAASMTQLVAHQAEVVRLERVGNRIRATASQLAASLDIDPPPFDGAVPPLPLHDTEAMLAALRREAEELGVRLDDAMAATDRARLERQDERDRARWSRADDERGHHLQRAVPVMAGQAVFTLAAAWVWVLHGGLLDLAAGFVVAGLLAVASALALGGAGARFWTALTRGWPSGYHPDDLAADDPKGIVWLRVRIGAVVALACVGLALLVRAVLGARLIPLLGLAAVLGLALALRERWAGALDEVRARAKRFPARRPE